eukprot:2094658-Amphidinium_carterae.1
MSQCVRKSGVPTHTTIRKRIQETHNTESDSTTTYVHREVPPGLAHLPPGGQHPESETEYAKKVKRMPQRTKRTMWA